MFFLKENIICIIKQNVKYYIITLKKIVVYSIVKKIIIQKK